MIRGRLSVESERVRLATNISVLHGSWVPCQIVLFADGTTVVPTGGRLVGHDSSLAERGIMEFKACHLEQK